MNLLDKEILNIQFVDTVFDPAVYGFETSPKKTDGKYKVNYEKGESALYKVWFFLVGIDLPFIDFVNYHLHETFPEPVRRVQRTVGNPNCILEIWTWGIFPVIVDIVDKSGRTYRLERQLTYGNLLKEYKNQIEFVVESSQSTRGAVLL